MQLHWSGIPPGPLRVSVGERQFCRDGGGGPGAATLTGLTPGSSLALSVELAGQAPRPLHVKTLSLPGEPLARVASLTDLHFGSTVFGLRRNIRDRSGLAAPAPQRCALAAVDEASAWGADLMVVKGDITHRGWHEQWAAAVTTLQGVPMPVVVTSGNHDWSSAREIDPQAVLARTGLTHAGPPVVRDLPGLRVIVADSALHGMAHGSLRAVRAELLDAVAEADRPVLLCFHHPPEPLPFPTAPSTGIRWPESAGLLVALRRTRRDLVISCGHSHRHRIRSWGGVSIAETGATRDYPGTWTQYLACEGGLVQVTRRMEAPEALHWTEQTGRALGGIWGRYAAGRVGDRCHVWRWKT